MEKYNTQDKESHSLSILDNQFESMQHGDSSFPCAYYVDNYKNGNDSYPWHWHEELEIAYVSQGEINAFINGEHYLLHEGEGCFINRKILHSYSGQGAYSSLFPNILFSPSLLYGSQDSVFWEKYVKKLVFSTDFTHMVLQPSVPWQADILKKAETAVSAFQSPEYGYEFRIREILSDILLSLLRNKPDTPPEHVHSSLDLSRILDMLSYIQMHYTEEIRLEQIAASASLSPRSCLRCFKNIIGASPMQYIIDLRIRKARQLLIQTDLSILEISASCGFQDQSYFIKTFRQKTGTTPLKFRKQL